MESHIALYGNIAVHRKFCESCQSVTFVVQGKTVCCNRDTVVHPTRYKRESEPEAKRRHPSVRDRLAKLAEQDNCCLYCTRPFDSWIKNHKNKLVKLVPVWDHFVPYSYSQNNHTGNFVAACQICNAIKRDYCFQTVEDARVYIESQRSFHWKLPAWNMPSMRKPVRSHKKVEKVLLWPVPVEIVGPKPPKNDIETKRFRYSRLVIIRKKRYIYSSCVQCNNFAQMYSGELCSWCWYLKSQGCKTWGEYKERIFSNPAFRRLSRQAYTCRYWDQRYLSN